MENKNKTVTVKDGNGDTFVAAETTFMDETIRHPPEFPSIAQVLKSIRDKYKERDSDVWLLTYSKSGTHWLYEILGILISGENKQSGEYKSEAMVEKITDITEYERRPSPRVMNTHIRTRYLGNVIKGKSKIIFMVRNPKSVAVSYYFHTKGIRHYQYEGKFSGYLPVYLEGYHNLYGSWFKYVCEAWDALKGRKNVHFVFYEELKKNPVDVIEGIAQFLDIERSREFYESVAELASFQNMSKAQGKGNDKFVASHFKTGHTGIIRKGIVDDWKNYFTVEQNEHFDKIYGEQMANYPELASRIQFE